MRLLFIALTLLVQVQVAFAGMILESTYPYSLEQQDVHTVYGDSTVPMYVNLRSSDNIKADKLFMESYSINNKFKFRYFNKKIIISIPSKGLEKHFLYYLVPLLDKIEKT